MSTTITQQRWNEGSVVLGQSPTTVGGTIETDGMTFLVLPGTWYVYTTSSSDTTEGRCYWWFDTSTIPDTATIIAVRFVCRYSSVFLDGSFSSIKYYLQNNSLGTSLDETDFNLGNTNETNGYVLVQDTAPVAGAFADSGEITAGDALSKISKTGYSNVIAKMHASEATGSIVEYNLPTSWRLATDVVPRLLVTYSYNDSTFTVGVPAVVGTPTFAGTPTRVGTPYRVFNP